MCGAFFNHKAKDQYQDIAYIVIIKNLVCYIYIKCEHDNNNNNNNNNNRISIWLQGLCQSEVIFAQRIVK